MKMYWVIITHISTISVNFKKCLLSFLLILMFFVDFGTTQSHNVFYKHVMYGIMRIGPRRSPTAERLLQV